MYNIDTSHRDIILMQNLKGKSDPKASVLKTVFSTEQPKLTLDDVNKITVTAYQTLPSENIIRFSWFLKTGAKHEGFPLFLTKYPLNEYNRYSRDILLKKLLK